MTQTKIDLERVLLLLSIVEKSVDHPNLKPLVGLVGAEVTEICAAAQKEWEELQKAQAEAKAKEEAEAAAKAKAEKDKAEAEAKTAVKPAYAEFEPEQPRRK